MTFDADNKFPADYRTAWLMLLAIFSVPIEPYYFAPPPPLGHHAVVCTISSLGNSYAYAELDLRRVFHVHSNIICPLLPVRR